MLLYCCYLYCYSLSIERNTYVYINNWRASNVFRCVCTRSVLQSRDFCQLEMFQANCSGVTTGGNSVRSRSRSLEVIYVQSARYGRMHIGRCVTRDYGHVGCAVDILSEVDALCSGRLKTCQFPVARLHSAAVGGVSHVTDAPPPCPGDLTSYLEASFICLPGKHGILLVSFNMCGMLRCKVSASVGLLPYIL